MYTENLDNINGLVVVKDLIQRADELAGDRSVTEIMRVATFVPETKRLMDLLREFQQKRVQLAIVVDEYGGTAGLVTVEDVVEELVGEIRDESDVEAEPIVRESEDTFVFSAKVATSEMADRLRVNIEDGEFETVGGYVLARVGRVPAVGERLSFDGLDVEILEAERRRIHKVRRKPDSDRGTLPVSRGGQRLAGRWRPRAAHDRVGRRRTRHASWCRRLSGTPSSRGRGRRARVGRRRIKHERAGQAGLPVAGSRCLFPRSGSDRTEGSRVHETLHVRDMLPEFQTD